ncbi:8921_t:CDS:1 [Paraglomus brasilianum]|uniref:8921_t:CDS:1 n=1 Tax=Paraglomus brasilianum TaxID=144538 RepID=A0A9N9BA95_9GLOM|nr:8921_t:CDS:1 [Paraglomus brasilianum]
MTSPTLVPILPTILFAIPFSIPYLLLLRIISQRTLTAQTLSRLTRSLVAIISVVPIGLALASDTAPNTFRWRMMVLWPWEEKDLIASAKTCVREVVENSTLVIPDDPRSMMIDRICQRLWNEGVTMENKRLIEREPKVLLIHDDDVLDGVSYPSSDITITTGWLRLVDFDEEMIAAIIAHEIAHILQSHAAEFYGMSYIAKVINQYKQIVRIGGSHSNNDNGDDSLDDGQTNLLRPRAFLQKHSQILEREADIVGQEIMARAGYDPGAAIELWQLMVDLEKFQQEQLSLPSQSSIPVGSSHGHGVRHSSEEDNDIIMHPPRRERVKYLTENLLTVQKLYEEAAAKGKSADNFEGDLNLQRIEMTLWGIFYDINGFS